MKPQGGAKMDAASVFRLISLIPERADRGQSGSLFNGDGSAKMDLLCRFLHWMGPLSALTKEEQQVLGARAGGGRSLLEADEEMGEEIAEELDDHGTRLPEAGTQIAA
jgi:hypothetical protein